MTDTRHRDVWRVWYHRDGAESNYALFVYAVDADQAMEIAERKISKSTGYPFKVISAEKR